MTQTQYGILAESLAHPDSTVYNVPFLYRLSDKVDIARLKSAIEAAVSAHPYLNATLSVDDHGGYRVRRDASAPAVEIIEAKKLPEDLVKPFDLMGEKLCRLRIYRTDDGSYLFMDFYHIIYDDISGAILLQDINAAYGGGEIPRETYTGYEVALDEQEQRKTERYERAKAYFDKLLAEAETDMLPEGDVNNEQASTGNFRITSEIAASQIMDFCKENDLTENALLNAAFAFVLGRYGLKEDVLYTTVCDGRSDARLERAVTMLVKTFPVCCHLDGAQSVADFARDVGRQLADSMDNGLYSFAEIANVYHIAPDVLFAWQGGERLHNAIGGEPAEVCPLPLNEAMAPIHIDVFEKDGQLLFSGDYRKDRYSEDYINRMVACLEQAVREFLTKPALKDVCLADARTCGEMDAFNATETDWPEVDIVSLFREAAEKFPDREAVIFKDETLTYRQVDEISERIAGFLRSKGVGKGKVVSVLIHRGIPMVTASLGVLKTEAAYQPLDSSYPSERLGFMMKDAGCALLITDEDLLEKVPEYKGPVLLTKDIAALPACERIQDHPAPEDLLILLYTSGTTGVPKGVMLEHRNVANFVMQYRTFFQLDESCRVSGYASYGFDACMMELYAPLTAGACLCIVEEEIRLDLVAVEAMFNRLAVTHSFMTTQVARQFYTLATVPSMRYLLTGGEKLVPVDPRTDVGTVLDNGYGPTECTVMATSKLVDKRYYRVPIGKPNANYKCYVVDANLNRLPPLVPGELLIAGRGVGRGYLNRPDLTEKAFIPNPFSDDPAYGRAYRTGDVVRLLPDGNIDLSGATTARSRCAAFASS